MKGFTLCGKCIAFWMSAPIFNLLIITASTTPTFKQARGRRRDSPISRIPCLSFLLLPCRICGAGPPDENKHPERTPSGTPSSVITTREWVDLIGRQGSACIAIHVTRAFWLVGLPLKGHVYHYSASSPPLLNIHSSMGKAERSLFFFISLISDTGVVMQATLFLVFLLATLVTCGREEVSLKATFCWPFTAFSVS